MTPESIAKGGSEHAHQAALFAWAAMAARRGFAAADDPKCYESGGFAYAEAKYGEANALPELVWFHAIPNGGSRGDTKQSAQIVGGKMKAEGVKSGVSDTFLPVRRGPWPGLYIEMKKPGGKPSQEQKDFGAFVQSQGFGFIVCDHWHKARAVLIEYLTYSEKVAA